MSCGVFLHTPRLWRDVSWRWRRRHFIKSSHLMKDAWYFFWLGHPLFGPVRVVRTWPDFFVGPGGTKTVGDLPVRFLEPVFFFFGVDLHGSLPSQFFFDNYDLGFFFWSCAPASWTLPPKGGNSIVIGANIGLDVFRPWHLFLELVHVFWTWHRVGGMEIWRHDACKKLLMQGGSHTETTKT